jgi:acetate---CoA ligase (ADP-forming)
MNNIQTLDSIFSPTSIAVVGASTREHSVGRAIFNNLLTGQFTGVIYPVNPKTKSISGVRCYTSISEIPDKVDLAVIVVGAPFVPQIMKECGECGVKGAIIISAGFKEIGGEGKILQDETEKIAKQYGIRVMGPNCLGVINTDSAIRMNATFATSMPMQGNIGFISQSGALCTAVLDYAKGQHIGFSKFISMGNKLDITENDLLRYLKDDPQTDVILLYLEQLTNGQEFIDICRNITGESHNLKPILAIKSGRTAQGAKAASSHTGSLSGSDEVYDAIFSQGGVLRVETVEELFDYAIAFANQPIPKGNRVAIVTNAGGPGIIVTDACIRHGLSIASLSNKTISEMKEKLPPTASLSNPIDVIGDAQSDRYEAAITAVMKDENVDGVIAILTPQAMTDIENIAKVILRIGKGDKKPLLSSFMGVVDVSAGVKILESNGMPHYKFPEGAARSFAKMATYANWIKRPRTEVKKFKVDKEAALRIIQKARLGKRDYLPEIEAFQVFETYGFPLIKFELADSKEKAIASAEKIGYPVVMKIASPDIVHKLDVGGVKLNLRSKEDVASAYDTMMATVGKAAPEARIWGVNIQEMLPKGREVILGMNRDPQFGPLLMFGLGGTYVEVFKDVTFRLAPIRELGAQRMIESIRSYKILQGVRGEKPSDIESIVETLERLSQLVTDIDDIAELDINPLLVFEKGKGCRLADGRILLKPVTITD